MLLSEPQQPLTMELFLSRLWTAYIASAWSSPGCEPAVTRGQTVVGHHFLGSLDLINVYHNADKINLNVSMLFEK